MIQIEQVGPCLWRVPPDARPGMRVPALVVADARLMGQIQRDASLEQLANAARGRRIADELAARGVLARATGRHALDEEMPEAHKDVQDVVDVVHRFGISTRVARLRPLAVIKG